MAPFTSSPRCRYFHALALATLFFANSTSGFVPIASRATVISTRESSSVNRFKQFRLLASPDDNKYGIIDLTDDDEDELPTASSSVESDSKSMAAPFLSQGELSDDPNLLNPDFNDPKQTRVIIYIILTLVPILFLVPLMIGSRDLIPLDALPPVELN
mmetsp:Transcript_18494/g.38503  ORF Transcript_18494/g.38503 Transcript_18494/m.38503 type:complete len:158 (-) Transcript_18494:102-575(-)